MRLVLTALAFLVSFTSAMASELKGHAAIVDGDTLVIGQQSIRLHGIDAPEVGQRCKLPNGKTWRCDQAAMDRLAVLTSEGPVSCTGDDYDAYDRLLAECRTADGTDINRTLVQEGLAWAFVKYSTDYVPEEKAARSKHLGIWQAETPAWDYRAAKRQVAEQKAPNGCPIKGNISKHGRIYHPPWSPWYSRTKISPEKGERWFCSEREALDAGWRAPRWR